MSHTPESHSRPLIVAIVGSGPSGFYAAEALLHADRDVKVHMIEKLPTPFGLVRYGVAPDHPKLKQVTLVFDQTANSPDFFYFGNIEVGSDILLEELKQTHDAIVFCTGADTDRKLEIPGEDIKGSHTATQFVAWYNGHPDYKDFEFDFTQETAVIIGQGNVAADVARILVKPVDELRHTDIASHALEQLAESKIKSIRIIGRRGPAQAKFTSKELAELGSLTDCSTYVQQQDFYLSEADRMELQEITNENTAKCVRHFENFGFNKDPLAKKALEFRFYHSPVALMGAERLEKIRLVHNRLVGAPFSQIPEPTDIFEELECGLCFRSIGYLGRPVPHVSFDPRRGVIPNKRGQVITGGLQTSDQLYTSGWIKRGATGIIGTNRADSLETVETLLRNFQQPLTERPASFTELLAKKGVKPIHYDQWKMIDSVELAQGKMSHKTREKIVCISKMCAIAG